MNFIQNLQSKSDLQKKKILIICLIILMTLVVVVWFLQMRYYSLPVGNGTSLKPISEMKNEIINLYNDSTEKVKNIKENLDKI